MSTPGRKKTKERTTPTITFSSSTERAVIHNEGKSAEEKASDNELVTDRLVSACLLRFSS